MTGDDNRPIATYQGKRTRGRQNTAMASYIALLRGVNLGAVRRLAMADLRAMLRELGFADAQTYLQSGNVLLDTLLSSEALAPLLEQAIRQRFGLEVPVLLRAADELAAVVAGNPFPAAAADGASYFVVFLRGEVPVDRRRQIDQRSVDGDQCAFGNGVIYAWYRGGMRASKLAPRLRDDKLGVVATARNWNTVTKLSELARGGS
jgi:uncharacterized protein (DUF1697 family)